jgi:hypothetical protein
MEKNSQRRKRRIKSYEIAVDESLCPSISLIWMS